MSGLRAWRVLLAGAGALAICGVSCAALFEDPSQCSSDSDCAKFGAVCDTSRSVCVARQVTEAAPDDVFIPPIEASFDAPVPENCNVTNKPVETIPAGVLPAGPDGGPEGEITGAVKLSCTKDWTLHGRVFVRAGATLTIDPGTTIRAEPGTQGGLVVLPGGRILAAGTSDAPIVFTSGVPGPAAGDWSGVVILGVAPTQGGASPYKGDPALIFGGVNKEDESGVLRFVRIEYGGLGLVFGGVGSRTVVDSVEVRKTNDNCFTFHGGTVSAKHLVCQYPVDDMFELSFGYAGRMQFLFGQKGPATPGAHGFLTDDSTPVVYNVTLCGDTMPNALGYGLAPRNVTSLDMGDAIFTGWAGGLDTLETQGTTMELRSSIAFGNTGNPAYAELPGETDTNSPLFNDDEGFDELTFYRVAARGNLEIDPKLVACFDPAAPKPWPAASLVAGARKPPTTPDDFFDTTASFIGAFRDSNDAWMRGAWVRFASD